MSTWRQSLLAGRRFSSTAAALLNRQPWKIDLLVQIVGGMLDLDGKVVPVGGARGCVPSKKVVPVTEEI